MTQLCKLCNKFIHCYMQLEIYHRPAKSMFPTYRLILIDVKISSDHAYSDHDKLVITKMNFKAKHISSNTTLGHPPT